MTRYLWINSPLGPFSAGALLGLLVYSDVQCVVLLFKWVV